MKLSELKDPFQFKALLWPDVKFYRQQEEIIRSVTENDETWVPAANKMGKDFVAGFLLLWFFLTRHPCRIVTTSAKADHLRVLWGEVGQFIQTSKYPLTQDKGGPLYVLHQELRKVVNGEICPKSYAKGLVASADSLASMQGHHIAKTGDGVPRTMYMSDESSDVPYDYYKMATGWCNRAFVFGNTWDGQDYWKKTIEAGDVRRDIGGGYYRRIIRIRAADSPNVRYGAARAKLGLGVDRFLIPGVKDYEEYIANRKLWDPIEQSVKLDAEFYEGGEVRLFPKEWMQYSERLAVPLSSSRKAFAIGIDPGEGVANTAWCAVDDKGVVELMSKRTADTSVIRGETIAFMRKHGVDPKDVAFDRGGGGRQIADDLRADGFRVRTVAFGEAVSLELRRSRYPITNRKELKEDRYAYVNRRAQMYGELSTMMDPTGTYGGFAIPAQYRCFREQLGPIPKTYDREGRLKLLPKNKNNPDSDERTLTELIGHSPDEADALVLAVHAMNHKAFYGNVAVA